MPEYALLFIHAMTGLHPGSGTALGVVDLPVQRERHTLWPIVPASSLKGVLRDACRRRHGGKDEVLAAFGPETGNANEHAGALSLTDARILAFPVRSLRGVFAWVTCPAVLERLNRDLSLAARETLKSIPRPGEERAACVEGTPLLIDNSKLVLEEFEFTREEDTAPIMSITAWIAGHATIDEATRTRITSHLVVLHDDQFTYFVRHATEVAARIALVYERKTVRGKALFSEGFLPPETLLYSVVIAEDSRRPGSAMDAETIVRFVQDSLPPYLQIGGDETIGKGICAVRLMTGKEA